MRRNHGFQFLLLQVVILLCVPAIGTAQDLKHNAFARDAFTAGINGAIGGITAGTSQLLAGKSFWRGFARGAGAGLVVFGGKRLIAERSPAAWWAGRELAAIGSSEVANAAHGRRIFQTLTLPVGPIRLHLEPRAMRLRSPTIDIVSTASAIVLAARSGSHFAVRESLATGTLVFITRQGDGGIGGNTSGVVSVSEYVPNGDFPLLESERNVISHELIHSAQYDFIITVWADPLQSAVVRKLPWTKPVTRFIDFNLLLPVQVAANALIRYDSRPWEKEAHSLVSDDR